ncbi:hypothetical protein [Bacillus xiapuensis]|uniref:hypothetical protein n=1 Tax=Bacillus xiapuensis TaxID=2014075 RepID=UPI000C23097D|nr:hypothetical protein [Bacillus xiapuensis]
MTREEAERLLEDLKNGNIQECLVSKDQFMVFRDVLVKREDFKHFKGVARRGGTVCYSYMQEARR